MHTKKVLVLGGGYAGLQACLKLSGHCEVKVIDKRSHHELLPELPHRINQKNLTTAISFSKLLENKEVDFIQGEAQQINHQKKSVFLKDGSEHSFDYLILALGGETNYFGIPGLKEHSLGFINDKQVDELVSTINNNFDKSLYTEDQTEEEKLRSVIVGGGGLTGVEVVGELIYYFTKLLDKPESYDFKIYLVEATSALLLACGDTLSKQVTKFLSNHDDRVEVILDSPITEAHPNKIILKDGREIEAGVILWTGGIRGHSFMEEKYISESGKESNWPLGRGHRLEVDERYRVKGFSDIFAVGDLALGIDPQTNQPFPQNGQIACKQGKEVAGYLLHIMNDQPEDSYQPSEISSDGVLVSLGPKLGTGTIYKPLNIDLPISIPSRLIKKAIEIRYKIFDIKG